MQANRIGRSAESRVSTVLGVLLIAVGVLLPAEPVVGAIIVDPNANDISPAYDGVSIPWNISGNLIVGDANDARLTITNGSRVTDANAFLARQSGSTAQMLVTGLNTQWLNSGGLYIGGSDTLAGGAATLTINSGGLVEADHVFIWPTGSLAGNGTLRADSIMNRGTISPGGDVIGTLTVEGNVTFWVNSVLEVQVNNSGASDLLHVVGDVNIVGGEVRVTSQDTIVGNKEFTILDANSVTGRFDALDTALMDVSMIDPNEQLGYAENAVVIRITAANFDLEEISRTPNQRALGVALQEIAELGGNVITAELQQLPTFDNVRASYEQLSGQSRPALAPIAITDSTKLLGIASNRLQGARGGVAKSFESLSDSPLLASAGGIRMPSVSDSSWDSFLWGTDKGKPQENKPEYGTWAKLYGLSGDRKTDGGFPGYTYDTFGMSFGIDSQLSDEFVGGVMGGYSSTDVDYRGLADTAEIGTTHIGLYSSYSPTGWYLNSVLMFSWLDIETKRPVDLVGLTYEGNFDGRELSGYIEVGFDWQPAPTWLVQPLAAFQFAFLHLDQYAEDGPYAALVFESQDYESYKASVGAKLTKELLLGPQGYPALLQVRGRYVHEFGDVLSSVDARFEDVPPISWSVTDQELSRGSILLGAGAGIRLAESLRAFVDYDTSFNSDKTVHVFSGAVEYRW